MLSPGMSIAMDVTILYLVMSPLVLFALYVAFDSLGQRKETPVKPFLSTDADENSILWADEDSSL